MFTGKSFLQHLGLSKTSLEIAGGVILFLIAIRMIFPDHSGDNKAVVKHEPFVVPLAIPLIAGPSAMAVVMLLATQQPDMLQSWILALVSAIIISMAILVPAIQLKDKLGDNFLIAMERLMGLILVALSVEITLRGLKEAFNLMS
jgi:small neutral amino acid transporter SnatA (MarC family)